LDTTTAHDVLRRLAAEAAGRSLLVATHLRREAELADRLLRMEEGQLVEDVKRGTPRFEAMLQMLRQD
jgi:ATP-binding cassette subfamily C protein CydC